MPLNKVLLVGRLTREVEIRHFDSGSAVARTGFAINNSRRNAQTGEWEDDPCFIDLECWNAKASDGRQLASKLHALTAKGSKLFVEGRLAMDSWIDSQTDQKRTKIKLVIDNFELLLAGKPDTTPSSPPPAEPAPTHSNSRKPRTRRSPAETEATPEPVETGVGSSSDIPF
jgi:single-strand DNA-binding protein